MERRRLMFMGLAGGFAAAMGLTLTSAGAAVLGDTTGLARGPMPGPETEADLPSAREDIDEDGIQLAQYGGPGRRRGPRCFMRTRNVRFRDRFGRVRVRTVQERVCR